MQKRSGSFRSASQSKKRLRSLREPHFGFSEKIYTKNRFLFPVEKKKGRHRAFRTPRSSFFVRIFAVFFRQGFCGTPVSGIFRQRFCGGSGVRYFPAVGLRGGSGFCGKRRFVGYFLPGGTAFRFYALSFEPKSSIFSRTVALMASTPGARSFLGSKPLPSRSLPASI